MLSRNRQVLQVYQCRYDERQRSTLLRSTSTSSSHEFSSILNGGICSAIGNRFVCCLFN